jgi:TM2 domain-containing membrane protein YozV
MFNKAFFAALFLGALLCLQSSGSVLAQDAGQAVADVAGSIISSVIPALIFGLWGITALVVCGFFVVWIALAVIVGMKQHAQMKARGMDKEWTLTFVLWFFLGWTGAHRIYNGDNRGFIILALYILGWITAWFFLGAILCFFLLIFLTTELFRLPGITEMGIEKRGGGNSSSSSSFPSSNGSTLGQDHQGQQHPSDFIAPPPPAAAFYADSMIPQPIAQYDMKSQELQH